MPAVLQQYARHAQFMQHIRQGYAKTAGRSAPTVCGHKHKKAVCHSPQGLTIMPAALHPAAMAPDVTNAFPQIYHERSFWRASKSSCYNLFCSAIESKFKVIVFLTSYLTVAIHYQDFIVCEIVKVVNKNIHLIKRENIRTDSFRCQLN